MRHKLLSSTRGLRTFALIFDQNDEVLSLLTDFSRAQKLRASNFSAIGAFKDVVLGWFDWNKKDYKHIPLRRQVEVLSLLGDVTLDDGSQKVHAHVVVGDSVGRAHGGHLLKAHVRPTLELFLRETPHQLRRAAEPLAQIDLIAVD